MLHKYRSSTLQFIASGEIKNAHKILTTQHTSDGTIVKVVYRHENVLGKGGHREARCNCNVLHFYLIGNHSGSQPQQFKTRLQVSVIVFCIPEKLWHTNSIKARSFHSSSFPIYPSLNMIIKLCLNKQIFIHYLNYILKAEYLCYALSYHITHVSFEISNPCNCKYFLFVLVVRLIVIVH